VHPDDVDPADFIHVSVAETRQQVVLKEAEIGCPTLFVTPNEGQVLLVNKFGEGGDRTRDALLLDGILAHGNAPTNVFGKFSRVCQR
jgi:hypothetical protein